MFRGDITMYINYEYNGQIETIEKKPANMSRWDFLQLLEEYQLSAQGYYLSNRATKAFYDANKGE